MSDVKRYAVGSYYEEPRPGGVTMVLATDYDALASRLAEAEDGIRKRDANLAAILTWLVQNKPGVFDALIRQDFFHD